MPVITARASFLFSVRALGYYLVQLVAGCTRSAIVFVFRQHAPVFCFYPHGFHGENPFLSKWGPEWTGIYFVLHALHKGRECKL